MINIDLNVNILLGIFYNIISNNIMRFTYNEQLIYN